VRPVWLLLLLAGLCVVAAAPVRSLRKVVPTAWLMVLLGQIVYVLAILLGPAAAAAAFG
jgi:hypothetical protein